MDKRVIKPLQQLLETFQGPTRLITKRQDKHLDFSACAQRAEKNKDPTKNKSVRFIMANFQLKISKENFKKYVLKKSRKKFQNLKEKTEIISRKI